MSEEALEEIKYYSEMYPDGIHKKETAKEMFEKLGYKEVHRFAYVKWFNEEKNNTIWFWQEDEHISVIDTDITMEVLQAINQQCKELGWYER